MDDGYEIRQDEIIFELPFFDPILASGDDIYLMCGDLIYTVEVDTNFNAASDPKPSMGNIFTIEYDSTH